VVLDFSDAEDTIDLHARRMEDSSLIVEFNADTTNTSTATGAFFIIKIKSLLSFSSSKVAFALLALHHYCLMRRSKI
jgi:hypothetical protein